ncbi:DUF4380 domain-containing protein [Stenotrophomonas sp. UBA7606]|uniref:DUF4380 domain-containing protein n=1 Tax=Stenotrophomonas sp. UBA7606 TaxID=1947559 RepID=UPI0025F08E3F|nr:DUF4380 domain-containing protein [Stenotrophomonas sp. UBA7606]
MRSPWLCLLLLPTLALAESPSTPDPVSALRNGQLQLQVSSAFGGRVLSLRREGQPNFLRVGPAVNTEPNPEVTAESGDIAYLGHDVWVGPQSQWWLHQQLNPQRRAAKANWPPDPWLSLAPAQWLQRDADQLRLRGAASPVTGMQLEKSFRLDPAQPDTVQLQVTGRNIRDSAVAWDLWFNTRVHPNTRVFVPVATASDIRVDGAPDAGTPDHVFADGMLVLRAGPASSGPRGKWFVQPTAGWMAGFNGQQVLIIRFAMQPRRAIHPEQAQVELYLDAGGIAEGLLEMEVHAPYTTLQPGEQMQAAEQWTLLAWEGGDDAQAQRAFLCAQQLQQACQ